MKITLNKLKRLNARNLGIEYFNSKQFHNNEIELNKLIEILQQDKEYWHLRWLYENLKLTGEYKSHHPNGQLKMHRFYKNGELIYKNR